MRRAGVGAYLLADITPGLANVATMAGGAFFRGVGTARGVFDRVRSEIVSGYALGIEVPSTEPDQPLDVVVKVDRRGVTVRAPHKTVAPESSSTPRTRLKNLLAQPVDVSDLPLAVATFSARGEEPTTLKAIVAAEIARKTTSVAPIDYAWVVTREGKPVYENDGVATELDDGARVVAAVQLAAGLYRLRFAAVDAAGKGGTVEAALPVGLRSAADIQFSDLFVGVARTTFLPVMRAPRSTSTLSAFVELYSSDPARFDAVAVELELRTASGAAVRTSGATMRATEFERRQVAEGSFEIGDLAPGTYTASAQISVGGRPMGRVSREVLLEP